MSCPRFHQLLGERRDAIANTFNNRLINKVNGLHTIVYFRSTQLARGLCCWLAVGVKSSFDYFFLLLEIYLFYNLCFDCILFLRVKSADLGICFFFFKLLFAYIASCIICGGCLLFCSTLR